MPAAPSLACPCDVTIVPPKDSCRHGPMVAMVGCPPSLARQVIRYLKNDGFSTLGVGGTKEAPKPPGEGCTFVQPGAITPDGDTRVVFGANGTRTCHEGPLPWDHPHQRIRKSHILPLTAGRSPTGPDAKPIAGPSIGPPPHAYASRAVFMTPSAGKDGTGSTKDRLRVGEVIKWGPWGVALGIVRRLLTLALIHPHTHVRTHAQPRARARRGKRADRSLWRELHANHRLAAVPWDLSHLRTSLVSLNVCSIDRFPCATTLPIPWPSCPTWRPSPPIWRPSCLILRATLRKEVPMIVRRC